jgi:hypothetical protein
MQAVLNLVWDVLLPAMKAEPLRADPAGHDALMRALGHLALTPVRGEESVATPVPWPTRTYRFPTNDQKLETLTLEPGPEGAATLVLRLGGAEQRIACGHGEWRKGRVTLGTFPEQPVAASGAWTASDTYSAKLVFYETPFSLTLHLRFAGDEVTDDGEYNVAFGPTKQPQLTGKAE